MALKAGNLDRRVTIQRATINTNAFNEQVATWADFITVWAAMYDVPDAERWTAQQVKAMVTTRFQIRYSSESATITVKDRIIFEGETYDILAVKELQRKEGIELTAAAKTDD